MHALHGRGIVVHGGTRGGKQGKAGILVGQLGKRGKRRASLGCARSRRSRHLPQIKGFGFTLLRRQRSSKIATPVLQLSALAGSDDRVEGVLTNRWPRMP
ncbi:MAG TPA: hypothetical protein VLC08_07910, partial [Chitinolyticbacter sp.]|nr:hypothetical protein [Chitinolyticbacter sp.]